MERLTERVGNYIHIKGNKSLYDGQERHRAYLQNAIIRLAAYEDTGLTPEEIMAMIPPPNDPLSLDELKNMECEPVWVESQGSDLPFEREWALVNRGNCLCKTVSGCVAFLELYGKSWLAYRRKPEEGTI